MFKVKKKYTRTTCQIYLKLPITYFELYSTVNIAELEQINVGWTWKMVVSDNKFVFSNYEK